MEYWLRNTQRLFGWYVLGNHNNPFKHRTYSRIVWNTCIRGLHSINWRIQLAKSRHSGMVFQVVVSSAGLCLVRLHFCICVNVEVKCSFRRMLSVRTNWGFQKAQGRLRKISRHLIDDFGPIRQACDGNNVSLIVQRRRKIFPPKFWD